MKLGGYLLLGGLILGTLIQTDSGKLEIAEWLIGTWENQTPRGTIYEEWSHSGTHEFSARSYRIAENDTIVFETIRLVAAGQELHYIPTVRNQNEGQPVVFKSEKLEENHMLFANPEHDFPQYISYTRIGADSLVAEIYGKINGQDRRMAFRMRKK